MYKTVRIIPPKRRSFSSIKHLPTGCGTQNAISNNVEDMIESVPVTNDGGGAATEPEEEKPTTSFEQMNGVMSAGAKAESDVVPKSFAEMISNPRKRRVLVARDFPPLCGRHAPRLAEDERLEAMNREMEKVAAKIEVREAGRPKKRSFEKEISTTSADNFEVDYEGFDDTKGIAKKPEFGTCIKSPKKSVVSAKSRFEFGGLVENPGNELTIYAGRSVSDRNFSEKTYLTNRKMEKGPMASQNCMRRVKIVHGTNCLSSSVHGASKENRDCFTLLETRKPAFTTMKKVVANLKGPCVQTSLSHIGKAHEDAPKMIAWDADNEHAEGAEKHDNVRLFGGRFHPPKPGSDSHVTRDKVRETLRLFQAVFRKLLQLKETKVKEGGSSVRRVDLQAAKILKEKGRFVNIGKQIIGSVPGVEVGDEFHYWVELNIIGLHRAIQAGIDYVKQGQNVIATSVVASGGYYDDDTDNSDVLIYMGSGGNLMNGDKEPEDQKLERGNLALKNSICEKNPVRVIRSYIKESNLADAKTRIYFYDGLYLVENYWQDMGSHGKLVFKFKLVRIPGQPELAWKIVKKSKKFKVREGLCLHDISHGKERMPICAVNTIDNEKPPGFEYVTHMIYPNSLSLKPHVGCHCSNGCYESGTCPCLVKNGGGIPYNHNGAIVEAKPLVYECGPSCECPPSCYNRVTQHGIKFQLEIFKTKSRGWGVRSLNSIPSGSFICEYAGELLEENEADQRTGNDEYLFDIGNEYNDSSLRDELSTLIPEPQTTSREVVGNGSFTIDAAKYGNVGRFFNHSCSPNLYAQNVLYDHLDKSVPHIMLFAVENIPPLQELTYHYNYMIDQVLDSHGNIRKKSCYCGASECTGRMY